MKGGNKTVKERNTDEKNKQLRTDTKKKQDI